MENATYLQNINNLEENKQNHQNDSAMPNFEVESIELTTPQLFSEEAQVKGQEEQVNKGNFDEKLSMFDNELSESTKEYNEKEKEPEMFDSLDQDEDLEIPAFLRRQKK